MTSRSSTTADSDWLGNEHAGQMLVTEFIEPAELDLVEMAEAIGVVPERIVSVIEGARPMDAELDLRLSRYFRMSEGFFLRLQNRYELVEAKRALNDQLERIIPRAA